MLKPAEHPDDERAARIAHDVNNLLAVILNYASFVSMEIADNEAALADVEQIRSAANHAVALTRELFDADVVLTEAPFTEHVLGERARPALDTDRT